LNAGARGRKPRSFPSRFDKPVPNGLEAFAPKEQMMGDDDIIQTPDGPMTWAAWKKKNPIQTPSRRTKGKDLPNKVKKFTDR
jgi:hypothetical protein